MKKVLLIGSSYSAMPLLVALKNLKYHVSVCGNKKNDPCHKYSDKSYFLDYSKKENLLKLVVDKRFDYIVPTCNDSSYISASYVSKEFNFPGFDNFEVTEKIHKKDRFKEFTKQFGIKAPRSFYIGPLGHVQNNCIKYPCIVKPSNLFSGRGIKIARNESELNSNLNLMALDSNFKNIVIDEYIYGSLHSFSTWIINGEPSAGFYVDEFCTEYPFQVNCSNHPSSLNQKVKDLVKNEIVKITRLLELNDGMLHIQFIVNGEKFWIIECMRRCPGDLFPLLIKKSTGIDYINYYLAPFIGRKVNQTKLVSIKEDFIARHTVTSSFKCSPLSLGIKLNFEELDVVQLLESGFDLLSSPYGKMAILLIKFSTTKELFIMTPKLLDHLKVYPYDF